MEKKCTVCHPKKKKKVIGLAPKIFVDREYMYCVWKEEYFHGVGYAKL